MRGKLLNSKGENITASQITFLFNNLTPTVIFSPIMGGKFFFDNVQWYFDLIFLSLMNIVIMGMDGALGC